MMRILTLLCLFPTIVLAEAEWPQFRGPGGEGVVSGEAPTAWSETEHIRFRTPLPGRGWSSPVVEGNQIWLTTAIEVAASEEARKAQAAKIPNADTHQLAAELSLRAVCVDLTTGKILHDIELFSPKSVDPIHALNSYASPTPVIEAGRLYCWFGTYGVCCVDTKSADVLWRQEMPLNHYVGPGSSPLLDGNVLVLTCDGADQQYVAGLDKKTGDLLWKTPRPPIRQENPDMRKSYCTPLALTAAGRRQVIIPGAQWLVSYDPTSGKEHWRHDHGSGFSITPRPVHHAGLVFFATGFGDQRTVAVRLDGAGDITADAEVWSSKRQSPTMPSPIVHRDRLYTISDGGVAVCYDAPTGKRLWQKRMSGKYSASPLAAGDQIYFFSQEGVTTILDGSQAEPTVVAQNELDGRIMATPAVVDGELLLRTDQALYGIGGD